MIQISSRTSNFILPLTLHPGNRNPVSAYSRQLRWNHSNWTEDDQFLRNFSVGFEQPYTHSSLRGGRDDYTRTGRLCIPDLPEVKQRLHRIIAKKFTEMRPLCWVEMHTPYYPFYEDIDIIGTNRREDDPPENLLMNSKEFWNLRAEILHQLFPEVRCLELTLYKASGWNVQKGINKASFHTVWSQLIVDKERAEAVRKATVSEFERLSVNGPLADLAKRLKRVNECNSWNAIFDVTSVNGGSCRMPFHDKIANGEPEGRPILPVGVWTFTFGDRYDEPWFQQVHASGDLRAEEWLERGTVRVPPDRALTSFRPLKSGWKTAPPADMWKPSPYTSHRTRQNKGAKKMKSQADKWEAQQRRRRRYFKGTPERFKWWIDWLLGDEHGLESTLLPKAHQRTGKKWCWLGAQWRCRQTAKAKATPSLGGSHALLQHDKPAERIGPKHFARKFARESAKKSTCTMSMCLLDSRYHWTHSK
ncbi:unnamed protein product [Symbiodinium sp. KB8]|nr:unnamed protein product [Symbiodinium sp. KB8]